MKKNFALSLLFLTLFLGTSCWADFDETKWEYYKEIENTASGLSKITLDDEIFSVSKRDLADVRIVDGKNQEVPFEIVFGKEDFKQEQVAVKMINNSFVPEKNSQVILDLGEDGNLVNELQIQTRTENFQRNVKVFGSNDMQEWSTLESNEYIYDFTDKKARFKSQDTKLSFPDTAFHYLKIEIADDAGAPVKIDNVTARKVTRERQREYARQPKIEIKENAEKKMTEIVADLGLSGIPVNKVLVNTKNVNFNRAVLIYTSDENKVDADWKYLGQGYIFRYQTPKFQGENLFLNFSENNKRFIKLEIVNKDDVPLSIESLSAFSVYREIIFEASVQERYRLFYGNKKAVSPQYDLKKYFPYLEVDKATKVAIGEQRNNTQHVLEKEPEKPLTERMPYLLTVVLVLTSLSLVFLVYRFLVK